uniref:Ribosomal protein S3 n=1 Tax=Rhodogorgon sp. TaxID=2485824 RepID=A0A3G3MIP6_9FLOR|nr:ribosomal protein S3 [Rhodogorgon sp.]
MAQKINPLSFRLGLLQIWNSTLQRYGKLFTPYILMNYRKKQVVNFLIRCLDNKELILSKIEFIILNHKIVINITYLKLEKDDLTEKEKLIIIKQLRKNLVQWFNSSIFIYFYYKKNWLNSAILMSNYITILVGNKSDILKKILHNNFKFVQNWAKNKKVIYYKQGIIFLTLKGFKICLSGCFDASRVQMTKTIKYNFGFLPLTKLDSYVEYSYRQIFTKYGTCGLKIWFFYEIRKVL